jgi:hypothetical protein
MTHLVLTLTTRLNRLGKRYGTEPRRPGTSHSEFQHATVGVRLDHESYELVILVIGSERRSYTSTVGDD